MVCVIYSLLFVPPAEGGGMEISMSRKQFGKRVTAILTAAVLGMSLGACGSGDEVSAGGRELSGAAQQNPEEKRADQGEQDETQKTTGQDEGTAEDLPGAGTGAADAAESKDGVSGNSAEGENADDMPTAPVGYGVTPENENPDLVLAIQPEVPYWFPAQLLEWEPEEDEELIFHKSTVPLAVRRDRERRREYGRGQCFFLLAVCGQPGVLGRLFR